MNIIDILRSVNEDMSQELQFLHGEADFVNLINDDNVFPAVFVDEPIRSFDKVKQGGYVEETYPLKMLFMSKSEMDWTPSEHLIVVEAMRTLAIEFINRVMNKEDANGIKIFREVFDVSRTNFINMTDTNASGCLLEFKCKPLNSASVCV